MSVRFYDEGQLSSGFIGYRVAVMVGGKHRQKWFSIKNQSQQHAQNLAERLNREWMFEQQLHQDQAKRKAKEKRRVSSVYTTDVSGIKMKYAITKRKGVKTHFLPIFMVQGSDNRKSFAKYFSIKRHGFNYAWYLAVEYYKDKKGISSDDLITRQPPIEQFFLIRRYLQNKYGYKIANKYMPKELDLTIEKEVA